MVGKTGWSHRGGERKEMTAASFSAEPGLVAYR
jgi:hypothetical protein